MSYIPDQGDICWITLNPQSGHEQNGRRPALVVSNKEYNKNARFVALHFATDYLRSDKERAEKTIFDLSNNRSKIAQEKKMRMIEKIGKLLIQYL